MVKRIAVLALLVVATLGARCASQTDDAVRVGHRHIEILTGRAAQLDDPAALLLRRQDARNARPLAELLDDARPTVPRLRDTDPPTAGQLEDAIAHAQRLLDHERAIQQAAQDSLTAHSFVASQARVQAASVSGVPPQAADDLDRIADHVFKEAACTLAFRSLEPAEAELLADAPTVSLFLDVAGGALSHAVAIRGQQLLEAAGLGWAGATVAWLQWGDTLVDHAQRLTDDHEGLVQSPHPNGAVSRVAVHYAQNCLTPPR
jgi:hypothetical protein